ncbi:hypothetical protein [Streptomyces humi]
MPDPTDPAPALTRIASDAAFLHRALRGHFTDRASTLAARIGDAQQLAGTALRLFLDLAPHAQQSSSKNLLLLHRLVQIAKAAQDAAAELTAALAPSVENQRRQADARSERVVLIGPMPQQFIESATDLLGHIPALCHAIDRNRPEFPHR